MANTTIHQSSINWGSLLDTLETYINSRETSIRRVMSGFVTASPTLYREWRTILLGGIRQSEKTMTLVNRALPLKREALFITVNKPSQESLQKLLVQSGTRGNYLPVVMTMKDFLTTYSGDRESLHKFKKIIVDDATYTFEHFRRNSFYDCVHNAATIDSLIYLIG